MRICGRLRTNEILDFSFYRLPHEVVERDLGEYAGKSMVRTWVQRLGGLGGKRAAERSDPQVQNRPHTTEKGRPCRK